MNRYLLFLLLLSVGCTNKQPACQLMTGLGDKDTLLWMCKSKGNELNRFIWKDPYGNIEYEDGTKVRIDYLNGYIFRRGKKVYYKDIYQVSKPRFLLNTSNEYEANIKDSLLLFDMNASIGDTLTESYFFMVNGNLIIKKQIKIQLVRKTKKGKANDIYDFALVDFAPGANGLGHTHFFNRHIVFQENEGVLGFYSDFYCVESPSMSCFISGWGDICFSHQDSLNYRVGEKYIFE